MVTKRDLHQLVDELPDSDVPAAHRLLRDLQGGALRDSLLLALSTAPDDDEQPTANEDKAVAEGRRPYDQGETRDWSDVREELAGG
jgi:hypothetical protein